MTILNAGKSAEYKVITLNKNFRQVDSEVP